MQESVQLAEDETVREQVFQAIEEQDFQALKDITAAMHAAELSDLLESLPPKERSVLWEHTPDQLDADVLSEVQEEVRDVLISEMDRNELVSAASEMDVEDLAEVIVDLPTDLRTAIEESLDNAVRAKLETSLSFEEDTAGRLMSHELVSVRGDISLDVVLRYLRRKKDLPKYGDGLFVVDRDGNYMGKLPVEALLGNDPDTLVRDVMEKDDIQIQASTSAHEVAQLFERFALASLAVVEDGKLLGRITYETAFEIFREEADHAVLSSAGLDDDEDLFSPVLRSTYKRNIWLGINLMTAFLASWVIGLFEGALDQIVALAVLMPIVASMGGIAGSQTLTLTIRGLALNQISASNIEWLKRKELSIGIINGVLWAVVVATLAWNWFDDPGIGMVIAAAVVINLIVAAMAGIVIPLTLQRMGIDPALSGAVILTTVTDVVGFMSFLGLATLFLLP